jgi:hypothetical protein
MSNAASAWRAEKNERALARLQRALPAIFPKPVLIHALSRSLIPVTPRRAVESYWRQHPLRADRLARALARASGHPEGWQWQLCPKRQDGRASTFRLPPAPFRESAYARGPGHCVVCGQPVFRFGWHRDLWGAEKPNKNAQWHAACVVAWKMWCQPAEYVQPLKRRQGRRCAVTGKRLFKTAEIDHRVPLHQVWREHRGRSWPDLLDFWGVPNLQVVGRESHLDKSALEAAARAVARQAPGQSDLA